MLIVYKESEDGEHKVIEVSGQYTSDSISKKVGHVNWYGSSKSNAADAINEAIADGFQSRVKGLLRGMPARLPPRTRIPSGIESTDLFWSLANEDDDEDRSYLNAQASEVIKMNSWVNLIDKPIDESPPIG